MSIYTMAFMGTVPFGNLLHGTLASSIGAQNTLLAGGTCCILGSLLFARQLPRMRYSPFFVIDWYGLQTNRNHQRTETTEPPFPEGISI